MEQAIVEDFISFFMMTIMEIGLLVIQPTGIMPKSLIDIILTLIGLREYHTHLQLAIIRVQLE